LVTFGRLGGICAVFRVVVALVSGAIGGVLVDAVDGRGERDAPAEPCQEACCDDADKRHWLIRMLHYGFVVLARDIGKALVLGLVVAALITALVPAKFFAEQLGGVMAGGIVAMLIMLAFGIPVYVCATASVPVAAALILKGVSPGAAMVFLMTGPATNAATIATIWKIMGRRTAAVYLATVAVMAVLAGILLDALFKPLVQAASRKEMEMLPPWLTTTLAVALLGLVAYATLWPRRPADHGEHDAAEDDSHTHGRHAATDSLVLTISGMTCSHCADSVRRALLAGKGVAKVQVDLDTRQATLSGADLDELSAREAVESLGYTVDGGRARSEAKETC
jgi:copper chaperone CopZ